MKASRCRVIRVLALLLAGAAATGAAEIDLTQLPPAAVRQIDFAQDVRPILESNCIRCHGIDRPKSNFRLTDRDSAMKGGANGVDIIAGNSGASPLIHYVARLVPDMEMPPEGKGKPLEPGEIGLLRAWIDQGAAWDRSPGANQPEQSFAFGPMLGWTTVWGDKSQFRDLEWEPEGWNGGVEQFDFLQKHPDGRSASAAGHAFLDDYKITLDLRKPDLGYTSFHFEQFRKYFSDTGGFYAGFSPSIYRLHEDLALDFGRAGAEFGLTLPNWPRIVLGYDYHYRTGAKSMLTWGPVLSRTGSFLDVRNTYPSVMDVDQHVHIVRFDAAYEIHGFELENKLRAEFFASGTRRRDALNVPPGGFGPNLLMQVDEEHRYTQLADTVLVQKEIAEWWLASAGYRYSWLDGDSSFRLTPQEESGRTAAGSAWYADKILLDEVWQVANANSQFRPLPHTTATVGLQGEWKHQDTFGDVNLDEMVDPADPTAGLFRFPAVEQSALDQTTVQEHLQLRYTGFPFTALFGEIRLKQEDYARSEEQTPGPHAVALASEASARWQEFRAGFNSSPWRRISFGGHYRHRGRKTEYQYPLSRHDGAYPGFIEARDILADEVEGRVSFHPAGWVKTTLSYQWTDSDFHTRTGSTSPKLAGADATPGGSLIAGKYQAHTASVNVTLTPMRTWSFSGTATFQNSRTVTFDNDNLSVAPYAGNLWSLFANTLYVLNEATDLFAGYSFSLARFGQHKELLGLPLGLDYDRHGIQAGIARRMSKAATARIAYGYFVYNEASSGHLRDYRAHQVLGVLNLRW